jgi:hypothetical protein
MSTERKGKIGLGRREALSRLGLAATIAYAAPTVLRLDRQANAVQPSFTGKGKGKGNPWCKGSGREDRDSAWEDWKRKNGNRYAYGYSSDNYGRDRDRDYRDRDRDRYGDRDRDHDRDRDRDRGYYSREKGRTYNRDRDDDDRRSGSPRSHGGSRSSRDGSSRVSYRGGGSGRGSSGRGNSNSGRGNSDRDR